MNLKKIFTWQFLLLIVVIILFIIFELPFISRPLYWDEAWSYGSAVKALFIKGPSLLPGAISEYLYRGHPMFFYFITVIWMKLFGPSLWAIHSLFIIVSLAVIFTVYFICKKLQNENAGLIAVLSLLVTPIFLAQASFMLPEVMLVLFSLLTFYFYFEKKLGPELIFGTLLLLTKESGLVLTGTLIMFDLIIKMRESVSVIDFFKKIPDLAKHFIPVIIASLFFILQKIKLGWFFFPGHVDLLNFDLNNFRMQADRIFKYAFRQEGRVLLSILLIINLAWLVFSKRLGKKEIRVLLFSGLFILNYIIFSAFNFLTMRYLIIIFPFFFIGFALIINRTFFRYFYISFVPVLIYVVLSISEIHNTQNIGDISPKFLKVVEVHEKAIEYCEKSDYYDKSIGTHFLMLYYLQNPFMGYLKGAKTFSNVDVYNGEDKDVLIISSIELNQAGKFVHTDTLNYELLKRFENNMAWCEVYGKKGVPIKEQP